MKGGVGTVLGILLVTHALWLLPFTSVMPPHPIYTPIYRSSVALLLLMGLGCCLVPYAKNDTSQILAIFIAGLFLVAMGVLGLCNLFLLKENVTLKFIGFVFAVIALGSGIGSLALNSFAWAWAVAYAFLQIVAVVFPFVFAKSLVAFHVAGMAPRPTTEATFPLFGRIQLFLGLFLVPSVILWFYSRPWVRAHFAIEK